MPRHRFLRAALYVSLAMATITAIFGTAFPCAHLALNTSPSLPIGYYRLSPLVGSVRRGSLVVACLPIAAVRFRSNHHLPTLPGPCAGHTTRILKRVAAIAGDRVRQTASAITVNGHEQSHSGTVSYLTDGTPLPHPPFGRTVVLAQHTVLLLSRADGFDSRYFGAVSETQVFAIAHPVWLFPQPMLSVLHALHLAAVGL